MKKITFKEKNMFKLQGIYDRLYIFFGLYVWMPIMIVVDFFIDIIKNKKYERKSGEYDDF